MPRGLHPVWGSERMTDKDVLMQTQCQATLAQDTSEARLFPLGNKWLGVILPLYTTRESVWKLKPNFSKYKTKQTSFNIKFLLNKRKTFFFFFLNLEGVWTLVWVPRGAQTHPGQRPQQPVPVGSAWFKRSDWRPLSLQYLPVILQVWPSVYLSVHISNA